ncbi:MAG TPA: VanW family protein [Byssovorax sp.]
MTSSQLLLALGIGSCVGLGVAVGAHAVLPESPVVRGLSIGGERVPVTGSVATWLAARDAEVRARPVHFRFDDRVFDATLGEAGVSLDVAATMQAAEAVAHTGSFSARMSATRAARRGEIDVPLVYAFDEADAAKALEAIAPSLAKAPVDATIDLDAHDRTPDVPGQALDVATSARIFAEASREPGKVVDVVVRPVRAKVTADDLGRVDVTKVVSAFETAFALYGTGAGRAVNIRRAAALLDGLVLAPGEMMSFNDRVGPRTRERGFALAPEIQGDELQLGIGGGTCQVSSTLHVAALYGALDVVERQSHSRPSAYAMLGLDATVSFPLADLKIKNSLGFPVLVHAYLPKPTVVRVEILGGDPVAKVDYAYAVNSTEDFARRVEVKSYLAAGKTVRHQKGVRGYEVTSIVKLHYLDGREDERHYFSGYRPAPEILYVAPGTPDSELPPLPEHATHTERKRGDPAAAAM